MLKGNLRCLVGRVEAVGGACGCNHWHRAFAVASVKSLQEVGLLALGRQTGGRTATLNVDDDKRKLVDDGEVDGLRFQTDARAGG